MSAASELTAKEIAWRKFMREESHVTKEDLQSFWRRSTATDTQRSFNFWNYLAKVDQDKRSSNDEDPADWKIISKHHFPSNNRVSMDWAIARLKFMNLELTKENIEMATIEINKDRLMLKSNLRKFIIKYMLERCAARGIAIPRHDNTVSGKFNAVTDAVALLANNPATKLERFRDFVYILYLDWDDLPKDWKENMAHAAMHACKFIIKEDDSPNPRKKGKKNKKGSRDCVVRLVSACMAEKRKAVNDKGETTLGYSMTQSRPEDEIQKALAQGKKNWSRKHHIMYDWMVYGDGVSNIVDSFFEFDS